MSLKSKTISFESKSESLCGKKQTNDRTYNYHTLTLDHSERVHLAIGRDKTARGLKNQISVTSTATPTMTPTPAVPIPTTPKPKSILQVNSSQTITDKDYDCDLEATTDE